MFGVADFEEESDFEDEFNAEMRRDWAQLAGGASRAPITTIIRNQDGTTSSVNGAESDWEDEVQQLGLLDHRKKRGKRFLRVPNRDMIEIIPGEKILIWMKETDPVFGRPNETPEEVQRNWTKVYAPDWFYTRVIYELKLDNCTTYFSMA
jgi:hypothetical protein